MKSVDKLREWSRWLDSTYVTDDGESYTVYSYQPYDEKKSCGEYMRDQCDEIEREIAEHYMLLPVDRSGETWHIGDKFAFAGADGRKHICTVSGVSDCEVFFYYDEHSSSTKHRHFTARAITHVKPRTLEDVLADFAADVENDRNTIETARRYAAEIRELLGGDDL